MCVIVYLKVVGTNQFHGRSPSRISFCIVFEDTQHTTHNVQHAARALHTHHARSTQHTAHHVDTDSPVSSGLTACLCPSVFCLVCQNALTPCDFCQARGKRREGCPHSNSEFRGNDFLVGHRRLVTFQCMSSLTVSGLGSQDIFESVSQESYKPFTRKVVFQLRAIVLLRVLDA